MSEQKLEFKTEVKQLLNLMIHSLYSHKEIFLRELISNASDAIDKAHYESLTNSEILEDDSDWKIKITVDKKAGTITVSDNGIGMTREEATKALGTIAHSGTAEFLKILQSKDVKDNPELIGQFGVGFYSSFMVADKVTVLTRKAGQKDKKGVKWESVADGSFTVADIEKKGKGTNITLHLKEEEKQYLEEWEIRQIVKKYSDFIETPVVMDIEREKESELEKGKKYTSIEEETLNSRKAIWLRDKAEITEDEYNEFYKHVAHDFTNPAAVIRYKAEGTSEFTALLYIPSKMPMGIFYKDFKIGPTLYVKRVQIMDHCEELIPPYLRFVKGVIDSSDLPLNVSREILQNNRQVETIRKNITKKVLETFEAMKKNEYEKYLSVYSELGKILKEGIYYEPLRKEAIADLLLYQSDKTEGGKFTTLQDYIGNMKEGQEEIYYILASNRNDVLNSPYLEAFREKDYDVLIMTDEIDDFIMNNLLEYKGKKFKSVVKGSVDLDKSAAKDKDESRKKYEKLIELIKDQLKNEVKDVRFSGRLKDSACCLVADEGDMDPNVEKMLRAMGQEVPPAKRILEINPAHPVFEAMNGLFKKDDHSPALKEYIGLLYEQALLLEGSKPKNPAGFARIISRLIVENAGQTTA